MKIIGREQNRTDDAYIQRIKLDQSLVMDDIIEIVKQYEKENAKLYRCVVRFLSDYGNLEYKNYYSVEDLKKVHSHSNPVVGARAFYVDPTTDKYKFDISADCNTSTIIYTVSKKMEEIIQKEFDIVKMMKEAKSQEKKDNSKNKDYQKTN